MSADERRIAVVTGASRGIGAAGARALAAAGCHVVAVARAQKALEALDDEIRAAGGAATLVPLDLKDGAAIDQLGGALFERYGRIDVLFAAAGLLGGLTPAPHLRPQTWESVIAVNLTANWRLIRSLDPLLRRSAAGRAVFVTSSVAGDPRAFWGHYAASKAGLEALARSYAAETEFAGLRVTLLDPGGVRTGMRQEAFPGEDPETLPPPDVLGPTIVRLCAPGWGSTGQTVRFRETADYERWRAGRELV